MQAAAETREGEEESDRKSFGSTSTIDRSSKQSIQQKWELKLKLKSNRNWNLTEIIIKWRHEVKWNPQLDWNWNWKASNPQFNRN